MLRNVKHISKDRPLHCDLLCIKAVEFSETEHGDVANVVVVSA